MSTSLVIGVNKGVGYAIHKQLAENPENLVIGTVRDQAKAKHISDFTKC